jgi:iron complex transport system substrate-binding protein
MSASVGGMLTFLTFETIIMNPLRFSAKILDRRSVCAGLFASVLPFWRPVLAKGDDGSFPLTVTHEFGDTTILTEPKRIVTLGWNCEDIVLALGHVPIAMEKRALFDPGVLPWNKQVLGSQTPFLLQEEQTDFEQIASLRPDLIIILSAYSKFPEASFRRFQKIAPTIVHQSKHAGLAWREQTTFIGTALGRNEDAAKLVQQTEFFLDNLAASNPVTRDKTFLFGTYSSGQANMAVYLPADARIAMLQRLGLRVAPSIRLLGEANPGKWRTNVSLETIDRLEADVVILGYGIEIADAVKSNSLLQRHRAIRDGRCVYLDDPALIWGSSALSVLSIPFIFGTFFDRIATSLGGS